MTKEQIASLIACLPGKVFISEEELDKHGKSLFYIGKNPEAVCYADSEQFPLS